ncbi:Hypothetical_protein [Hexamita inflata]|uniref:Hypothetical_protein n=1 Tax=Hexamita inflata TaxID=28002 RepID=A0AA86UV33_9EUKA|nr:Hypothetical protein HINF_LOCUS53446 [Hexamita inflata]
MPTPNTSFNLKNTLMSQNVILLTTLFINCILFLVIFRIINLTSITVLEKFYSVFVLLNLVLVLNAMTVVSRSCADTAFKRTYCFICCLVFEIITRFFIEKVQARMDKWCVIGVQIAEKAVLMIVIQRNAKYVVDLS